MRFGYRDCGELRWSLCASPAHISAFLARVGRCRMMSPKSSDTSSPHAPEVEVKLDSWKQIAAYLEREVRTVQRWEKSEGLPVHRHHHGSRGTVFAFRSEVDAWLASRSSQQGPEPSNTSVPPNQVSETIQRSGPGKRRALVGLVVALLIASVWLAASSGAGRESGAPGTRLLVLPLAAIGEDPLETTTGHGLHEELITGLARLAPERLSVIGRTSALRYGATGLSLAEIGDALGVEYVLEGSIRQREGALYVTSRLVRASEESEMWSANYSLDIEGLEQAERRVSRAICEALAIQLVGIDPTPPSNTTENSDAHAAWLRGRYLWHKGTHAGFSASLPHFEQALEHDNDFVEAHVGLANSYNLIGRYGRQPASEVFPRGKAAAQRALELDPNCAEAHAALAMVHFYYDWDFEAAAREFETALRLGPELALTHHTYAHFLSCMGLHEQGLAAVRRARELEPLWPLVIADTAWFHYRARDFTRGAEESRRALELEPGMASAVLCLVACLRRLDEVEAAWVEMRSYLDSAGLLAKIPGLEGGDPETALRNVRLWMRAEVERAAEAGYVSAHSQVFSLTELDRDEEVLSWLEESLVTRDRVALLTLVHPAFDDLRKDARFQAIVDQVGFDRVSGTGGRQRVGR